MRIKYIISIMLLFAGCSDTDFKGFYKSFTDLNSLQGKLSDKFSVGNIHLAIHNGTCIGVNFVNTRYRDLEKPDKMKFCSEVVDFVKKNYRSIDKIDSMIISFTVYKNYIIYRYTDSSDAYFFKRDKTGKRWVLEK